MANPTTEMTQHGLVRFADAVDHGLDEVGDLDPMLASTSDKKAALLGPTGPGPARSADDEGPGRTRRRGHRLRTPRRWAWLADATRTERPAVAGDLALGQALGTRWTRLGCALGDGSVNLGQTKVIARVLDDLPAHLDAQLLAKSQEHLIDLAATHRPRQLERLGRHLLHVIDPSIANAKDARRIEAEERRARETTRLEFTRLGAGSTRITIKVPDRIADRFGTYLDAFTSPGHGTGLDGTRPAEVAGLPEADRIPAARKRGIAFAAVLEHLEPKTLPDHGGDATTVMITLSLEDLRRELGTAGVTTSDHSEMSATEARRLACTAQLTGPPSSCQRSPIGR